MITQTRVKASKEVIDELNTNGIINVHSLIADILKLGTFTLQDEKFCMKNLLWNNHKIVNVYYDFSLDEIVFEIKL